MVAIQDLLYQLRLADQSMTQLFERQLGISLTCYQILCFLIDQSPCNQIAVQERLKIDQAALTRHFKILEKEGLVNRRRNPVKPEGGFGGSDRLLGEQLITNSPQQHINVKNQMESVIYKKGEREEFSRLLEKLISGLEEIEI